MSAVLDTLGMTRDLEAAGIERKHAEAIAQAIHHGDERAATKADLDQLRAATKTDLDQLRAATKDDIAAFRAETKADLAAFRAETKADLAALRSEVRADLHRALWIQGVGIIAILSALRLLPI